jgi:thiamine kinase-like enzyme
MPSTEVSQNDSTSPAWLTADYVESILRKYYDDIKLKVIDFEVGPCCGKGENFIAVMFRVKATFLSGNEQHTQSLVLKTLPVDEVVSKAMGTENYDVQSKEIEFFEKVAPEFTKVLDSLDADFEVFPKAFAVDHERDVIILDDLNVKKFVMKDRLVGLDNDHMQLVVRKLAAFHASSLVVHEKNPDAFKSFDCGIFGRKVDVFQYHFRDQLKAFTDEVASWGGYEYYATKLEKMADSFIERANQSTDYDEGDFNVLLHGDLWLNNIMFKYDGDGNLQDAILIDFQLMFHGSPAIDLFVSFHYFSIGSKSLIAFVLVFHVHFRC